MFTTTIGVVAAAANDGLPPANHPGAALIKNFGGQLRCPFADLWLSKGPKQAAIELGLDMESSTVDNEGETEHRNLQGDGLCELAPGPAGAAHQAAMSAGYLFECPGTPAEGSPYQWPLMWSANVEQQSVPFQSDEVVYESRGTVYYRLDKNWKRADTTYSRGIQRAIGQSLCPPENIVSTDPVIACERNSDRRRTMIHRKSKMWFISWKNGTTTDDVENIESCTWLDLGIVGNVRPDWFMDARGEITDVQYLGDQHVYYENMPTLVKQWRKKDFASQYFTMSMLGNPGDDGVHWPLILNVPGEGFGDDFLQKYTNHSLLSEADEDLFLLDQALEAAGGSCPMLDRGGGGGPPVGGTKVPSNLEIDENAWCTKEYTFSPVWEPPPVAEDAVDAPIADNPTASNSYATTEVGIATVASCYDSASQSVKLQFTFDDVEVSEEGLPWLALGYRKDEECLMIPKDGSDTDIILIATNPATEEISASKGSLSAMVRSGNPEAVGTIYPTLSPLENADGFSNVKVLASETQTDNTVAVEEERAVVGSASVELDFSQEFDVKPEAMHMMYAVGTSPRLGYHASRRCFEITEFPDCNAAVGSTNSSSSTLSYAFSAIAAGGVFALSFM